jgi:hypothetical protein
MTHHVQNFNNTAENHNFMYIKQMGWMKKGLDPIAGRDFPHPSRSALRPTQPPSQRVPGLIPSYGVAWAWP